MNLWPVVETVLYDEWNPLHTRFSRWMDCPQVSKLNIMDDDGARANTRLPSADSNICAEHCT